MFVCWADAEDANKHMSRPDVSPVFQMIVFIEHLLKDYLDVREYAVRSAFARQARFSLILHASFHSSDV
jgi:hypothetical protein